MANSKPTLTISRKVSHLTAARTEWAKSSYAVNRRVQRRIPPKSFPISFVKKPKGDSKRVRLYQGTSNREVNPPTQTPLPHRQQGPVDLFLVWCHADSLFYFAGYPSPMDRVRATRLGVKCIHWLEDPELRHGCTSAVIGIRGSGVVFSDSEVLEVQETDFETRRSKVVWWSGLKQVSAILSIPPPSPHFLYLAFGTHCLSLRLWVL